MNSDGKRELLIVEKGRVNEYSEDKMPMDIDITSEFLEELDDIAAAIERDDKSYAIEKLAKIIKECEAHFSDNGY
jgi:hypothetical protein